MGGMSKWVVDSLRLSNKEWAEVRPGREQTIVTCPDGNVSDVICCVFAPDRRDEPARATLIASAPDLLEALEEARRTLLDCEANATNGAAMAKVEAAIDEELSRCLSAKPEDPCEDLQEARDQAVADYNGISSPPDSASYAEFQTYFAKR